MEAAPANLKHIIFTTVSSTLVAFMHISQDTQNSKGPVHGRWNVPLMVK
jgi:hypothetical protein